MPKDNIIGQKINPAKAQRARELRRRMTPEEKMLWQRLRANRDDEIYQRDVLAVSRSGRTRAHPLRDAAMPQTMR